MAADRSVVLVVDDEPAVLRALTAMLRRLGFEPVPVAGGAAAVEACRAQCGRIAAVVLNVQMPGPDGPATLARLRALDPRLPCLFVTGGSGYSSEELRARGAVAVLMKPLAMAEFGRAVAAAVERGRP